MRRVVSLNIRHGGGRRTDSIMGWVAGLDADFVLLTEWRANNSGQALRGGLADLGYDVQSLSRGNEGNGLLMASRTPLAARTITPHSAPRGELALAVTDRLTLCCAYFPQARAKAPFFDAAAEAMGALSAPGLLIGDLNTGRNDCDLEPGATRFHCAEEFAALSGPGELVDLWRRCHGDDAREWTWRSARNGFRIDHAFGNRALLASFPTLHCRYDHTPRELGWTDHSGLLVDLD